MDHVLNACHIFFTVVMGGFFVGCVAMAVQLQPSDHPPQLFKPDTNLQRLLDLKANFSMIDDLKCDQCSALYNVSTVHTCTIFFYL